MNECDGCDAVADGDVPHLRRYTNDNVYSKASSFAPTGAWVMLVFFYENSNLFCAKIENLYLIGW